MATIQTTVNKTKIWFKRKTERLLEQRWRNLGLRAKMGAMVTTGMLGLMTIFGLLALSSARQATQQALNERLMLTQMSADALDTMLIHIVDDLVLLAQSSVVTNLSENLGNYELNFNQLSTFHEPIYLINPSSELIASSTSNPPPIPWNEIPAVQFALEGKINNLSAWPQYQPGAVVITTPITNSSGRITGVLATLLNISDPQIFSAEGNFEDGHSEVIDLVDQDGQIVFSSQEGRVREILTEELILTQLFNTGKGGVETCLGCPGTKPEELSDEVVSFAPLSSVSLGVVIRQPAEEVFSSVRRLFVWHTLMGLVSMVGALGLVWVTTNSVIDPLKTLNDAAQRIARGDLDTPTEPLLESWPSSRPRRDEIGALGLSFDSMRMRLKDSNDEVQTLNRDLDARVQERTAQAITAQKESQAARDDLQAIIDALSDEMIVIGVDDHRVVQVNQACREKNKDLGEITRLSCFELFHDGHPCDSLNFTCPLDEVIETEAPVRETHIRTAPGGTEPVYLDIIASPLRDAQGKITRIVEMVRDVTKERLVSESLVRRNEQLAILNAIATTVSKSLDIKEILGLALEEVIQRTGVEVGAIFLMEDVLGQLNLVAHFGLSEEAARMVSQYGMLDGACGGVIDHGQLVVVPDITGFRGQRARTLRKEKLTTLVHVPLMTKGNTLGSMCVGTRQPKEFGDHEQKMLMAIGKQIAVAIENARLYAELQQKEQVRRELFRKAINAQEEERKRIARELHDDTSQALTALIFAAEEGLVIDDLGEIKTCLDRMHLLTRQTLDGVHKLLFDLRPSMLDHLGLMSAIRWFAKSRLEPQGVRVSIKEENHSCRLYPEAEIALFRVIQEAITNITRHAGARNVQICCDLSSDQAVINISDDGIGFDPALVALSPETGHGLGLLGMSERLELVGGDFGINSVPGEGTRIDISVPLRGNGRGGNLA
jgi:signal transduction histidine kinase/HAMP domain-containing protein